MTSGVNCVHSHLLVTWSSCYAVNDIIINILSNRKYLFIHYLCVLIQTSEVNFSYFNLQSEMKVKVHVNHFTASWYSPVNFVLTFFSIACTRIYMDVSCIKEKYIFTKLSYGKSDDAFTCFNCNLPQKDNQHFFLFVVLITPEL